MKANTQKEQSGPISIKESSIQICIYKKSKNRIGSRKFSKMFDLEAYHNIVTYKALLFEKNNTEVIVCLIGGIQGRERLLKKPWPCVSPRHAPLAHKERAAQLYVFIFQRGKIRHKEPIVLPRVSSTSLSPPH